MKIYRTPDGIVRAGGWLQIDGKWLWRGLRFAQTHERMSEAAKIRRGCDPEAEYADEALSPEQRVVVSDILRGLGTE